MPEIRGVHHVSLTVTDMGASAQWYGRLFDMQPVMEVGEANSDHRFVVLAAPSGLMIGLHQFESTPTGDRFSEFRVGMDHVGFTCTSRSEVEAWQAKLDQLGIAHSGITDAPYGHVLVFRDPDNIQLEMFALSMS